MSLTRQIAHNSAIQIVGKIISTLLGLVALGMMTRYLGTEQFGWYVTVMSFLQFVGILIDFGLIPVTAQMMSEPAFDKKHLFQNLLGYRFTTAVMFLGLAPLAALFIPQYPTEVKIAIGFMSLSFLAVAMNQVLIGMYQTKLKMHIAAGGEVIGRAVLVVGLWLLIQNNASFFAVMGMTALGSVVYTAVLWVRAIKESPPTFRFDWAIWKAITLRMWPIAVSIMFNVVYLKGDVILLSMLRSQTEVGLYGAAYRVVDILSQTAMMIMGVILPILAFHWSRGQKTEFQKYYQIAFDAMMFLALPISVGVAVLAKPLIIMVAGNEFAAAAAPLAILMLAIYGVYLGAVFGHAAVAINKQKQVMWIYISAAVLTLVGYLTLIPAFGMFGAAWMTVFSEVYVGILLFLTIRHYTKERLNPRTFAVVLFSSLVMAGALIIFSNLPLLLRICIGAAIYLAFTFGFGIVSKKMIQDFLTLKK